MSTIRTRKSNRNNQSQEEDYKVLLVIDDEDASKADLHEDDTQQSEKMDQYSDSGMEAKEALMYEKNYNTGNDVEQYTYKESKTQKGKRNPPRCHWTNSQVEKLIDILHETRTVAKVAATRSSINRNELFRPISEALNTTKFGLPKTAFQCRVKYKKLRLSYFHALRKFHTDEERHKHCQRWDKLHMLFSKCPEAEYRLEKAKAPLEQKSIKKNISLSESSSSSDDEDSLNSVSSKKTPQSKSDAIIKVLKTFMDRSFEETKKRNEWFEKQLEKQSEANEKVLQAISRTFQNTIASLLVTPKPNSTSTPVQASPVKPTHTPIVVPRNLPSRNTAMYKLANGKIVFMPKSRGSAKKS